MVEGARGDLDEQRSCSKKPTAYMNNPRSRSNAGAPSLRWTTVSSSPRQGHAGTTLQAALDIFTTLGAVPFIDMAETNSPLSRCGRGHNAHRRRTARGRPCRKWTDNKEVGPPFRFHTYG